MKKKYIITLTEEERQMLGEMISRGKAAARKLTHARILLKADQSQGGRVGAMPRLPKAWTSVPPPWNGCESGSSKKGSKPPWIDASRDGSIRTSWTVTARPI